MHKTCWVRQTINQKPMPDVLNITRLHPPKNPGVFEIVGPYRDRTHSLRIKMQWLTTIALPQKWYFFRLTSGNLQATSPPDKRYE